MKSKVKFKCPSCGKQINAEVEMAKFNEAVKLDPPCQCGFSQVVLSALSSGIDSITTKENES
ncbi:hypothetical protein ACFLZ2_00175 [Candidatus Margulisiibacteriota bacterium]